MKKFKKSIDIWRRYEQEFGVFIFLTHVSRCTKKQTVTEHKRTHARTQARTSRNRSTKYHPLNCLYCQQCIKTSGGKRLLPREAEADLWIVGRFTYFLQAARLNVIDTGNRAGRSTSRSTTDSLLTGFLVSFNGARITRAVHTDIVCGRPSRCTGSQTDKAAKTFLHVDLLHAAHTHT